MKHTDRVVMYDVSPIDGGSPEDTENGYVPSITLHDLTSTYRLNDTVSVGFGIRNIFDKLPPGYVNNGGTSVSATNASGYDVIGRRIFGNVRIAF